jgi:formylmethanofuran dehydrogenase subunit E
MAKKDENGWTVNCENCKKPMGDLAIERSGKLVCRKCADKMDGRVREEPEPDE